MPNNFTHWVWGQRDTTEFPALEIDINADYRDHLRTFCGIDGLGWNAYDDYRAVTGMNVADSRLRTYRKMYELLGLIYKGEDVARLSQLGTRIKVLEDNLNQAKGALLDDVRSLAVSILSRYQLDNPVDGDAASAGCDVQPFLCIWKVMRALDNKINYEEMNRVVLRIPSMADIDAAVDKIRTARAQYGNYDNVPANTLATVLGAPVHTGQFAARIAPWFSCAGWGGLLISQQQEEGYRRIVPEAIPFIDQAIANPPTFFATTDQEAWREYYIGAAATVTATDANLVTHFTTGIRSQFERNRIIFGAPGTGKSFLLNRDKEQLLAAGGYFERVTFHPEYTYSQFVGSYKPVTDEAGEIRYEYVPGPFMRVLVEALKSAQTGTPHPCLLLIEEINRAKVAAVFGEVFQLLDRDDNGCSEYEIHTTEDICKFLREKHELDLPVLRLPDNMFIWASMNSADQGVFPIDTAFKRRWNFEYIGVDDNDERVGGIVTLGGTDINWNVLRKTINFTLASTYHVNEDKLLGPYFLSRSVFAYGADGRITDPECFIKAFKNKVIMYLYEDAAKSHRHKLFEGCDNSRYSSVCVAFDQIGIGIFGQDFVNKYNSLATEA